MYAVFAKPEVYLHAGITKNFQNIPNSAYCRMCDYLPDIVMLPLVSHSVALKLK